MHGNTDMPAALGRIPSGIYILTAAYAGQRGAMLVSWVQQAGFAPPVLTVAIARDRAIRALIDGAGAFALCVLGKDDTALMRKYARTAEPGDDPLADVAVAATPAGLPYLTQALAYLECKVLRIVDFGADHDLYLAEITAGAVLKPGPSFTHLRASGLHY